MQSYNKLLYHALVEHQLPKLRVASSSLVCRSHRVVPFDTEGRAFFMPTVFQQRAKIISWATNTRKNMVSG